MVGKCLTAWTRKNQVSEPSILNLTGFQSHPFFNPRTTKLTVKINLRDFRFVGRGVDWTVLKFLNRESAMVKSCLHCIH